MLVRTAAHADTRMKAALATSTAPSVQEPVKGLGRTGYRETLGIVQNEHQDTKPDEE